jgi:UDP-galactopyranose mutase
MSLKISIVGAGMTGATIARQLADAGYASVVYDQREHVAGNCHTVFDTVANCYKHEYGPHIFHTNNTRVLSFVNRFCGLAPYKHEVKSLYAGKVFSLPINLHTINQFFENSFTPIQAEAFIKQLGRRHVHPEQSFEGFVLHNLGPDIYNAFFKNYTTKQWGVTPDKIPASVIKRLPIRFNYDSNYFHHTTQGLPELGYTDMVEKMLTHPLINCELGKKISFSDIYETSDLVFWSGPIEEIFNYDAGTLPYRTLDFCDAYVKGDAQGCAVMNFADSEVAATRQTQHNYFRSTYDNRPIETSLVTKEFSREWEHGDVHYYPVHLNSSNKTLENYQIRSAKLDKLHLCGRLGRFRYIDMDVAIAEALDLSDRIIKGMK